MAWRKMFVDIDDATKSVLCITDDAHWNGWECPRFTKEEADKVVAFYSNRAEGYPAQYNQAADQYEFFMQDDWDDHCNEQIDEDNEDSGWEIYKGYDIWMDGEPVHVYAIGAWSWIWSESQWDDEPDDVLEEIDNG